MNANDYKRTLEIDAPLAVCGHCRFATALSGAFGVENGRLVWRGDAAVQPRRGPDLESCCESDPLIGFKFIEVDGVRLSAGDVAALRETARVAAEAQMAEWAAQEQA